MTFQKIKGGYCNISETREKSEGLSIAFSTAMALNGATAARTLFRISDDSKPARDLRYLIGGFEQD